MELFLLSYAEFSLLPIMPVDPFDSIQGPTEVPCSITQKKSDLEEFLTNLDLHLDNIVRVTLNS